MSHYSCRFRLWVITLPALFLCSCIAARPSEAAPPSEAVSVSASEASATHKAKSRLFSAEPGATPETEAAKSLARSLQNSLSRDLTLKQLRKLLPGGGEKGLVTLSAAFSVSEPTKSDLLLAKGKVTVKRGDLFVTYIRQKDGGVVGLIESFAQLPGKSKRDLRLKSELAALGFKLSKVIKRYQIVAWKQGSASGLEATVAQRPSFLSKGLTAQEVGKILVKPETAVVKAAATTSLSLGALLAASTVTTTSESPPARSPTDESSSDRPDTHAVIRHHTQQCGEGTTKISETNLVCSKYTRVEVAQPLHGDREGFCEIDELRQIDHNDRVMITCKCTWKPDYLVCGPPVGAEGRFEPESCPEGSIQDVKADQCESLTRTESEFQIKVENDIPPMDMEPQEYAFKEWEPSDGEMPAFIQKIKINGSAEIPEELQPLCGKATDTMENFYLPRCMQEFTNLSVHKLTLTGIPCCKASTPPSRTPPSVK